MITCLPPYPIVVCVSTENRNADVHESTFSTQIAALPAFCRSHTTRNHIVPKKNQLETKAAEKKEKTQRHFASMSDVKKSAKKRSLRCGMFEARKLTRPFFATKRVFSVCLFPLRDKSKRLLESGLGLRFIDIVRN